MKKKLSRAEVEAVKATVMRVIGGWVNKTLRPSNKLIKNLHLGPLEISVLTTKIEDELGVKADSDVIDRMVADDATVHQLTIHFAHQCAELNSAA